MLSMKSYGHFYVLFIFKNFNENNALNKLNILKGLNLLLILFQTCYFTQTPGILKLQIHKFQQVPKITSLQRLQLEEEFHSSNFY